MALGKDDLSAFRDSVLAHLAHNNVGGLLADSDEAMARVFVGKFIHDIRSDNPWNDVLYLMASKLIEISPRLGRLRESLDSKRQFVSRPDADLADLMVIESDEKGLSLRLRD